MFLVSFVHGSIVGEGMSFSDRPVRLSSKMAVWNHLSETVSHLHHFQTIFSI
jgi:hypothetical protein